MAEAWAGDGDTAELAAAAETVLKAEGLCLNDLKARILDKAYLGRHQRPLLLFPAQVTVDGPADDERFPGRKKLVVGFTLLRGSYATLVIQFANISSADAH